MSQDITTRALYDILRGPSPAIHIAPDVSKDEIQTRYPDATIIVTPSLTPGIVREYRFIPTP